jgi:hypothetical protein
MRREVHLITHIYLLPGLNPRAVIISPEPNPVGVILLGLWVRIPPGAWMFVSCERCVLSRQGLCVGLTTRPEGSYRVWRVWVWSRSLVKEGHKPESGRSATVEKKYLYCLVCLKCVGKMQYARKKNINSGAVSKRSSLRGCTCKKWKVRGGEQSYITLKFPFFHQVLPQWWRRNA